MAGGGFSVDLGVDSCVELTLAGEEKSAAPVDSLKITVTLEQKSGQKARLRIQAPPQVRITRPEREKQD